MKSRKIAILIFVALLYSLSTPRKALTTDMQSAIRATYPSSNATNVPQNLDSSQAGSYCTSTNNGNVCSLRIGLGITPSYLNKNSSVTISSPSDPNLGLRWGGESENSDSQDFYHSSYYFVTTTDTPNGTILMPNATYTVTVNDGAGINYSWSFKTEPGNIPSRQPEPVNSSQTNSPPTGVNMESSLEEMLALKNAAIERKKQAEIKPSPSPSSSPIKTIIQKKLPASSPTPIPEELAEDSPTPSPIINHSTKASLTIFQSIQNFLSRIWFRLSHLGK